MLANTSPSKTTGWMSIPVVGVAVISLTHSSSPVAASSATTPVDPYTANTRPSATATPNGPMLKPLGGLDPHLVSRRRVDCVDRPGAVLGVDPVVER